MMISQKINTGNHQYRFSIYLLFVCIILTVFAFSSPAKIYASPVFREISDNRSDYSASQIPKHSKLEITFQLDHEADSPYIPYSLTTPNGVPVEQGITVNAEFTPDDWQTVYVQPAFYFQNYENSGDWYYPIDTSWKVRFSPNTTGIWQFRLTAQDKTGKTTSETTSFNVQDSESKGFIRVSTTDSRYFEFEDGSFFPGLGLNTNAELTESDISTFSSHGVELLRVWWSQMSLWGSSWNPWQEYSSVAYYTPWTWLTYRKSYPGSDFSMEIRRYENLTRCLITPFGIGNPNIGVRQNTDYRIKVRYYIESLGTKIDESKPVGFAVKFGGWLWDETNEAARCYWPGTGQTIAASYQGDNWTNTPDLNVSGWTTLETIYNSGNSNYLPRINLGLDNTRDGVVYIDQVWIEEVKSDGSYGPNIHPRPDMDHHTYPNNFNAYRLDQIVGYAEKYNVYLRPVISEKHDWAFGVFDYDGNPNGWGTVDYFYGNYRNVNKTRYYLQAYWRYLQARYGYSSAIHSWELLNEGDPVSDRHWTLTDEFGKFMRQYKPNNHLVSTSFWHSFMSDFWGNTSGQYGNIDFADLHAYISTSFADTSTKSLMQWDAALFHQWHSDQISYPGVNPNKPVIRGEAGFDTLTTQDENALGINNDKDRIWLHNYLWAGLYHGGMYEQYWWTNHHIKSSGVFDNTNRFTNYNKFLKTLPLNNGYYKDAGASVGNELLRAWGQKDTTNNRAHLWIQNSKHTWKNVVDGVSIEPISSTVSIGGFTPNAQLRVEWWDTYSGEITSTETIQVNNNGDLVLEVSSLTTDIAVRVGDYSDINPPPPPPLNPGDTDNDGDVDIFDYNRLVSDFGNSSSPADFNRNGIVDIYDYNTLISNFGS